MNTKKIWKENYKQISLNTKRESLRLLVLYKQSLKEIDAKIAQIYRDCVDTENKRFYNLNRLKTLQNQLKKIIQEVQKIASGKVKDLIVGTYETTYYNFGKGLEKGLGTSLAFGLLNTKQINAAIFREPYQIRWTKSMKENHAVYYRDIKEAIAKGVQQGKGYDLIAKDVRNRAEVGAGKTIRIINTETHRAVETGTLSAYSKVNEAADTLGLKTKKQWIATDDERTRNSHRALHEKFADAKGLFYVNGHPTEAPGMSGIADEDINCRCTTVLEIT